MMHRLKKWFQQNRRTFPWRESPSPYAVWVSEIMLQQTRASVVVPYFTRWMARFPDVETLAAADIAEVFKLWEGLGYYSRARSLHEGAKYIVENYEGRIPQEREKIEKIKGIGPYTVGAIRSFAFHQREPAVDGNVVRVVARLLALQDDISKGKTVQKIRDEVARLLPENESWIVSEALIELGATVCKKKPECHLCPLQSQCKALLHSLQEELPFSSKRVKIKELQRTVGVLFFEDKVLLKQVEPGKIMSGLHEFFYLEGRIEEDEFLEAVCSRSGVCSRLMHTLNEEKHSFTRYKVTLFPYWLQLEQQCEINGYRWYSKEEVKKLAFSSGHRRILKQLVLLGKL